MKKASAKAIKTTTVSTSGNEIVGNGSVSSNQMSDREKNVEDQLALNFEFDEDDVDDDYELDPAIKEEIERTLSRLCQLILYWSHILLLLLMKGFFIPQRSILRHVDEYEVDDKIVEGGDVV